MTLNYQGRLLPSGNSDQIPTIVQDLIKLGVDFQLHHKCGQTRIKIPRSQVKLLPTDERGTTSPVARTEVLPFTPWASIELSYNEPMQHFKVSPKATHQAFLVVSSDNDCHIVYKGTKHDDLFLTCSAESKDELIAKVLAGLEGVTFKGKGSPFSTSCARNMASSKRRTITDLKYHLKQHYIPAAIGYGGNQTIKVRTVTAPEWDEL